MEPALTKQLCELPRLLTGLGRMIKYSPHEPSNTLSEAHGDTGYNNSRARSSPARSGTARAMHDMGGMPMALVLGQGGNSSWCGMERLC